MLICFTISVNYFHLRATLLDNILSSRQYDIFASHSEKKFSLIISRLSSTFKISNFNRRSMHFILLVDPVFDLLHVCGVCIELEKWAELWSQCLHVYHIWRRFPSVFLLPCSKTNVASPWHLNIYLNIHFCRILRLSSRRSGIYIPLYTQGTLKYVFINYLID